MMRKNKLFLPILSMFFVVCTACTQYNDVNDSVPSKQLFDFGWRFILGDVENGAATSFDDSQWRGLDLPHDWSIEGKFDANHAMGNDGGYLPDGIGWYRKTFVLPASLEGKKLNLMFEGVYMNAEVYVNGKLVCSHPYGYTSFPCDISSFVRCGEKNVLAVRVDNSKQKNCRWYSGSGIYRHVWLTVTNKTYVDRWGVAVTTPPQDGDDKAVVCVKAMLKNELPDTLTVNYRVTVFDHSNAEIATFTRPVTFAANDGVEVAEELPISHPRLWSPDSPTLYRAQLTLERDGATIDSYETTFGIRYIAYNAQDGFLLNGKPLLLNGGCVHHDNGCLGAAAYDRAEERRVELLKEAGFNAVRTSHNPQSEAFLSACDRLGLLVIDEVFDGWRASKNRYDYSVNFDAEWQNDIRSMVLRDRNHPSIFCWSIGNEIIERKEHQAIETAKKLEALVHQLDFSRPVTSGMTTWDSEWEIFDTLFAVHQIAGYNYQLHRALTDHQRVPERVIMQTESYPRDAFANWNMVDSNPYVIGDFVWTAMDYLGESGIGRYYYKGETEGQHWENKHFPWHGAYCGDIDLIGWRKPISHYRNLLFGGNEKLYLSVKEPNGYYGEIRETMWSVWPTWESWTWNGHEGKPIQAEIYSRYPAVRLYLNDELVTEQLTGRAQEYKAVITLPYRPGVLRVAGVEDGKEVENHELRTAGEPAKIELVADRTTLQATGQDLCFVTVKIIDEKGIINPNAELPLTFEVKGNGVIAGVDNANLKDTCSYIGSQRNTWKGRALAVIKASDKSGEITLNVSSPQLASASVKLQVK